MNVHGQNTAPVFHQLRAQQGLSTGRSAHINDKAARRRCKRRNTPLRRNVLDVKKPVSKSVQPFRIAQMFGFQSIGQPVNGPAGHPLLFQQGYKRTRAGFQCINAQRGFCRCIVGTQQSFTAILAQPLQHGLHKPNRVAVPDRKAFGCCACRLRQRALVTQDDQPAQNGICIAASAGAARLFSQLDRFVNSGIVGHPVEKQHLKSAQPQGVQHLRHGLFQRHATDTLQVKVNEQPIL